VGSEQRVFRMRLAVAVQPGIGEGANEFCHATVIPNGGTCCRVARPFAAE
jgi:hypothetical protein